MLTNKRFYCISCTMMFVLGNLIVSAPSPVLADSGRVAVVNPDHYRTLKGGVLCEIESDYVYLSMANAMAPDTHGNEWQTDVGFWQGVGEQTDYIGGVLENAGYQVDYFEASELPAISSGDYDAVFIQDPLRTHLRQFTKSEMETSIPDLLEHVSDPTFLSRIDSYACSGGRLVLVGDAVRLLEDGPGRLNGGKTITATSISNQVSQTCPLGKIPGQWLFVRGNPFCGHDRTGSGTYTVESGSILPEGTLLSFQQLSNLNDIPTAETWSDTIYAPSDGESLLDVRVAGSGEYVLNGSVCDPPEYTVTVDGVLEGFVGYTLFKGQKVYYIGSDSFFDYQYLNFGGAWHAGQYSEIVNTITPAGEALIVGLVPEPATLSLLALGGWAVLRKRRRR